MNAIFAISKAVLFLSIALSIAHSIINTIFAISKGVLVLTDCINSIAVVCYSFSYALLLFHDNSIFDYNSQNTMLLMFAIFAISAIIQCSIKTQ